jgi:hypothetical protein
MNEQRKTYLEFMLGAGGSRLVTLATQEAEIRRIAVGSQPRQIVRETLSQKTFHKTRTGEWLKMKFKPQYLAHTHTHTHTHTRP